MNFRVEEMNWRQWRSDVGVIQEEDPGNQVIKPQSNDQTPGMNTRTHARTQYMSVTGNLSLSCYLIFQGTGGT